MIDKVEKVMKKDYCVYHGEVFGRKFSMFIDVYVNPGNEIFQVSIIWFPESDLYWSSRIEQIAIKVQRSYVSFKDKTHIAMVTIYGIGKRRYHRRLTREEFNKFLENILKIIEARKKWTPIQ